MHDQSSKDKRAWDEHTSHYKGYRQSSSQHASSLTHHWAAAVTILAPIGISAAEKLGLEPRAIALAIALASSMAFRSPLVHTVNVLVMGTAGYTFRDYARVGTL